MDPGSADVPSDGIGSDRRIVAACQGLELKGMKYSPGGETLPNKCAPFDVFANNPYAIRCIDAMPDFATEFPGDEYCILPPPPDQGFQVGVHPGGNVDYWNKMWAGDYSFYRDPKLTADYELPPGGESVQNYDAVFEGPTAMRYFYRRQFRGRYGSHHGIARFTGSPVVEERWQDNGDFFFGGGDLMNTENSHTDFPQRSIEIAPEEVGLGFPMLTNGGVTFNLHHFNSTDKPILRENWINGWYVPGDRVSKVARTITGFAGVNYPPGMVIDNAGSLFMFGDMQVLSLYGHHHAWTSRFHAWVVRADGSEELVYDSNDFWDMPTFSYNSTVKNPEPGIPGKDGAASGPLILRAGDTLHFNCHVETTQERANELGVPMPTAPLAYGCKAFEAEMCLLRGQATDVMPVASDQWARK